MGSRRLRRGSPRRGGNRVPCMHRPLLQITSRSLLLGTPQYSIAVFFNLTHMHSFTLHSMLIYLFHSLL